MLTDRAQGVTAYEYWDNGLLKKVIYPNATYADYNYDFNRGWLTRLTHKKANGVTVIADFTYSNFMKNGVYKCLIEDILKPDNTRMWAQLTYDYDNMYRLTRDQRIAVPGYTKYYPYDKVGNRKWKLQSGVYTYYHYDAANKLVYYGPSYDPPDHPGNTALVYDAAGNLISKTPPSGPATTYEYGWQNLMTAVKVDEDTIAEFTYDGDGQRRTATFGEETTSFLYDEGSLIEEVDDEGELYAFYNLGPDGRISRETGSTAYYHGDQLGSVKAITDGQSPANVTDAYVYDAWGNGVAHYGSTEQPYQYVGRLGYYTHHQAPTTGLLQLGVRYYDPWTGRFTQRDPIKGGVNYYVYVENWPTGAVDPTGLFKVVDCIKCFWNYNKWWKASRKCGKENEPCETDESLGERTKRFLACIEREIGKDMTRKIIEWCVKCGFMQPLPGTGGGN